MESQKRYFRLFPDCVIVEGIKRTAIYDLKGRVFFIPEKFSPYISSLKISEGIDEDILKEDPLLNDLCENLNLKGLGDWFTVDISKLFQDIDFNWESPYIITNAIIDIGQSRCEIWERFIKQLGEIRCPFIQIRILSHVDIDKLYKILKYVEKADVLSVQMLVPFSNEKNFLEEIDVFVSKNPRVAELILYNSKDSIDLRNERITISQEEIINVDSCGQIGPSFFVPSVEFFSESKNFNSCLNRKISLTADGYIKNCPSMKQNYGHIMETEIKDIVDSSKFKFWWNIKKDEINTCKSCEFRYMCSDCRAYIEDPNDPYSKPSKCSYNPKTLNWQ